MRKTFTKETTITLYNELPNGLNYNLIFNEIIRTGHYVDSVDFYYDENGTVSFFKIFDTSQFLEIIKLDFTTKTYKSLKAFLTQKAFQKSSIIFYNYEA